MKKNILITVLTLATIGVSGSMFVSSNTKVEAAELTHNVQEGFKLALPTNDSISFNGEYFINLSGGVTTGVGNTVKVEVLDANKQTITILPTINIGGYADSFAANNLETNALATSVRATIYNAQKQVIGQVSKDLEVSIW